MKSEMDKFEYNLERQSALEKLQSIFPTLLEVAEFYYLLDFELEKQFNTSFEEHLYSLIENSDFLKRTHLAVFTSEMDYDLEVIREENDEVAPIDNWLE